MTEADEAVAAGITFEAKKDGCQQQQSGEWKLTLKIHPNDVSEELMLALPGQRYMCVLVALGDDEAPLAVKDTPKIAVVTDKPKRDWDDIPPQSQVGIALGDVTFIAWFRVHYPDMDDWDVESAIKNLCGVARKRDLETNTVGRHTWQAMYSHYRDDTRETAEIRG